MALAQPEWLEHSEAEDTLTKKMARQKSNARFKLYDFMFVIDFGFRMFWCLKIMY